MTTGPRIRHAVRVLLIDEQERVLLMRFVPPDTGRAFWHTPGGGVEPGEDVRAAAAREVHEETGLRELPLGAEVWRRRHHFTWKDTEFDQRERWFLARVAHFHPVPAALTEEELAGVTDWRWWTLDELERTDDRLAPLDLGVRLRELVRDGPPPQPMQIGA